MKQIIISLVVGLAIGIGVGILVKGGDTSAKLRTADLSFYENLPAETDSFFRKWEEFKEKTNKALDSPGRGRILKNSGLAEDCKKHYKERLKKCEFDIDPLQEQQNVKPRLTEYVFFDPHLFQKWFSTEVDTLPGHQLYVNLAAYTDTLLRDEFGERYDPKLLHRITVMFAFQKEKDAKDGKFGGSVYNLGGVRP
jgi:hypothetical protein